MTTQQFLELVEDELDKQFPKGMSRERGNAIVLIAMIIQKLEAKGIIVN